MIYHLNQFKITEQVEQPQQQKGQYEHKLNDYEIHFQKEIEQELQQLKEMKQEDGSELPKSRVKKLTAAIMQKYKKMYNEMNKKVVEKKERQLVDLKEDSSLPAAKLIKINKIEENVGQRVEVQGWIHKIHWTSQKLGFITLRDGHGFVQCTIAGDCAFSTEKPLLCREASIMVKGMIVKPNVEKKKAEFQDQIEIQVDYFKVIGTSDPQYENLLTEQSGPEVRQKLRHLVHRTQKGSAIIKLRSHILYLFREYFESRDVYEVNPPTIVNTQCEGGADLFKLDYYGKEAYMTQSSQLYLESIIHGLGDVFCVAPSYRAEKSCTRRHLAEFTHLETEHAFCDLDQLMDLIQGAIVHVYNTLYTKYPELVKQVTTKEHPLLKPPFKRMTYVDALKWLNDHNVMNDKNEPFQFGDDIAETQERFMIDTINEPVFLCYFPAAIKAFYMPKCKDDQRLTKSVDLLVPGVGEIVGGSERIWQYDDMVEAMKKNKLPLDTYSWYLDVRKYGGCVHSGMGLGVDRLVCWLLDIFNIRDAVLYPRAYGLLEP